ncbi:hypothetical protein C8R46DRAFT_1035823 [Mycena filopes]|nr:hypothetical protein C8R46DRAFT_1035823 [Mycena filopes]
MSTDIRPDRIVIVLPSDFAHLVDRARPALQRWRSRRRRRGCAAIAPVFREYPDGKEWRARRERGSHRQCVLPVKLPTNKSTPKGKGFATHVHENKDRSTSWSVMRTSRSANAMEVPEESKASDPTDYGWSAHPENADSKTVWWRKAEDHERRPKKEVGKMQSIARDAHTKPTRIYSAQRWAQGHCRQDAAALPETMPTPVRHRLWHLLEARAVTSRVRSHLLLTSAGVAVTVHEEADNGEGIAVIELDGMSKSADREKSLPWCQDAARVAQQPNTVPTSVWHRPQHLLGHIAEGRYSDERRALLQGRAQSHLLLASTGGAVTVGVHGSWSKLGETSSTPPMTQRVDGDKEPPQGVPESGGNLGRGALLTTIEMVFRKRRQKHRHNGRTFKYRKRGAATNDDRPEKG